MSKIANGTLDQYGAEAFEQQQFGTAGIERVKALTGLAMKGLTINVFHLSGFICFPIFPVYQVVYVFI